MDFVDLHNMVKISIRTRIIFENKGNKRKKKFLYEPFF